LFDGTFNGVTAIYQVGFVDGDVINFVSIESSINLGLCHLEKILKLDSQSKF
jgi:hypothetical protein